MSRSPGRVVDVVNVELPRPRDRLTLAGSPQYAACRGELLQFLYRKQMRAAA
jgi:nitrate/nitrite transport system ATP-binding protein